MRLYLYILFIAMTASGLFAEENKDDPYSYKTDSIATKAVNRPYSKMWRLWMTHHKNLSEGLTKQEKVDLLMIGDSIIFRFCRNGASVWKDYYVKRNGYNFGSSGDRTEHILWRLQNANLSAIKPKLVVLLIGTNNTSTRRDETPEQTADGIEAITKEIKKRLPTAKILLLGIFPRGKKVDDKLRARNDKVNEIISKLEDKEKIHYLDLGHIFLNPDKTLNKELISDTVHPIAKGFEVWAEAMEPKIKELLGEK